MDKVTFTYILQKGSEGCVAPGPVPKVAKNARQLRVSSLGLGPAAELGYFSTRGLEGASWLLLPELIHSLVAI